MLLLSLWAALPAITNSASAQAAAPKPITLKPGKIYEKCLPLTSAQALEYQYQASKPVDFNIHYHRGDLVYYPVKRNKSNHDAGRFRPTAPREDYCLMWENRSPSAEVEITYQYKVAN